MTKTENRNLLFSITSLFTVVLSGVVFFFITMPFRQMFQMIAVTEVRPASALPPVLGMLFGVAGAIGCALGNLVADILSGYSLMLCFLGFLVQFMYGWIPYLIWHGLYKNKRFHLNSMYNILRYIGIICLDSFFVAGALGILTEVFGYSHLVSASTILIFFNNVVFCMILGIPIFVVLDIFISKNKRKVFSLNVRFVLMFLMLSVVSAVTFGVACYREKSYDISDAMQLWNKVYEYVALDFLFLCSISILFLWFLEKNITIPIEKLSDIARSYADAANADHPDSEKYIQKCNEICNLSGEPGYLAIAFCKMLTDVERYVEDIKVITKEKEKIKTELYVASQVQKDMLPNAEEAFSERNEFILSARMNAAKGVGGDFYDFFLLDEDHLVFLVSDVSGKGIPAALFMVMAKTLLMSHTKKTDNPAQAFEDTNNSLCDNNKDEMFVTSWMGVLALSSGELVYINAGHNPPLCKHKDGEYTFITERSGFVLAGMEHMKYKPYTIKLLPEDRLFVYSDGVTEAHNEKDEIYGEERLRQCLTEHGEDAPKEQIEKVWEELEDFKGKEEQFDDITMLALQYLGDGYEKYTDKADIGLTGEIEDYVEKLLIDAGVKEDIRIKIRVVIDEIYSNICRYGNAVTATVACKIRDGKIRMYFEDDGVAFNPLEKTDPDISSDVKRRTIGGLGIYMVRQMMDKISYERVDDKNRLKIEKQL